MPQRPAKLPDFKNPPLVEVAMSVQFDELSNFRSVHAGLLWEKFRKKFPQFAEQPEIPPKFETFGGKRQSLTRPQIKLVHAQTPSVPRYWFLDKNGNELIQFQQNKFVHNWRKNNNRSLQYPRYEHIRSKFSAELRKINAFLRENELGKIVPNQAEITYVNMIELPGNRDPWTNFGTVFNHWTNNRYQSKFGNLEHSNFSMQFVSNDENGDPFGRLYTSASPAVSDEHYCIRFELVFRGSPKKQNVKSTLELLDAGREKIIFAFAEMTTPALHRHWERTK